MKILSVLFASISAVLLFSGLNSQAGGTNQFSAKDMKFIQNALMGGQMEVSLGRLAAQKGLDQSVKDFGNRMTNDHKKAGEELKTLLIQKGIQVPAVPDQDKTAMTQHLQKLDGHDFDKMYVNHMVKDHNKDIADFEAEAKNGDDPDLKNWASKTLPVLQEHLKMARTAQNKIESSSNQ
jgi:putative membrane protein